jgi:opacity protein-like surface antigen
MIRYHHALTASIILLMSSKTAFAYYDQDFFPEIILMGGASTIDAEDTSIIISGSEVDSLSQTNRGDWDAFTLQAGFGYAYFLTDELSTGAVDWFPYVTPQINVYYLNGDAIEGDAHQIIYDSTFDTLDYTMNLQSTRAMFDVGLTVAKVDWFSIYAIGGIGVAWNQLDFNATPNQLGDDCGVEGYQLDSENSSGFAYEFGGGISISFRKDLALSLEYLYSGLTDVELGNTSTDSEFNAEGPEIDINNQSILLGLRFAIK